MELVNTDDQSRSTTDLNMSGSKEVTFLPVSILHDYAEKLKNIMKMHRFALRGKFQRFFAMKQ